MKDDATVLKGNRSTRIVQSPGTIAGLLTDRKAEEKAIRDSQNANAVKSRWGWHPVSYEDFKILKDLHKLYWETWRQAHARWKWGRKCPHNRVRYRKIRNEAGQVIRREVAGHIPEPFCDDRVIDWTRKTSFTTTNGKLGLLRTWRTHNLPFGSVLSNRRAKWDRDLGKTVRVGIDIVEDFHAARMPQEKPEDTKPVDMTLYRALHARLFTPSGEALL
jgi:hypothetical protein